MTSALSRKSVSPRNSTYSISATARKMFSSDSRRMPLSTPDTAEAIARTTETAISPAWTPTELGTPNRNCSP